MALDTALQAIHGASVAPGVALDPTVFAVRVRLQMAAAVDATPRVIIARLNVTLSARRVLLGKVRVVQVTILPARDRVTQSAVVGEVAVITQIVVRVCLGAGMTGHAGARRVDDAAAVPVTLVARRPGVPAFEGEHAMIEDHTVPRPRLVTRRAIVGEAAVLPMVPVGPCSGKWVTRGTLTRWVCDLMVVAMALIARFIGVPVDQGIDGVVEDAALKVDGVDRVALHTIVGVPKWPVGHGVHIPDRAVASHALSRRDRSIREVASITREHRVDADDGEDSIVIELGAFPVDGGVTAGAVVRVPQLSMGRWVAIAVLGVAAQALGGRGVAALDVTVAALRPGVPVIEGEELVVVEDRAPPAPLSVTVGAVVREAGVTVDAGVGPVLVGDVTPHARPGRDGAVL